MKEVKIAFIGCGGNANGHMNQLSGIEGARIVAVCDVQAERAQSAAEKHNADPILHTKTYLNATIWMQSISASPFLFMGNQNLTLSRAAYRFSLKSLLPSTLILRVKSKRR